MKLFAYSYVAVRGAPYLPTAGFSVGYAEAVSEDEAMGIAIRSAIESRPESEGWTCHKATVMRIKPEHIAAAAKAQETKVETVIAKLRSLPWDELLRRVAEEVFGDSCLRECEMWYGGPWNPMDCPKADYRVLELVRRQWRNTDKALRFMLALRKILGSRPAIHDMIFNGGELPGAYEPGDYALAALAAQETGE